MSDKTTEQRFWEKVDKSGDCWVWTGNKTGNMGYGVFRTGKTKTRAHRYSYELHKGPIQKGMLILHTCDTPTCIKPSHLILGTHQSNTDDRVKKKRSARGEKNGSSKLTEKIVKRIREEYSCGNTTMMQLAEKYRVGQTTIFRVIHAENWKHM